MGYKEVVDLDCENAIAIGGINKKTGKPNPTSIEGYYLGSRQVPSKKSKTGFAALHVFQTKKGNVGVWGKTNLDTKLASVTPGTMTLVKFVGMVETKNNPMYKYSVATDTENTIEVAGLLDNSSSESESSDDSSGDDSAYESTAANADEEELDPDEEEAAPDEVPPARAARPAQAAKPPTADRASRVQALLNGAKTTKRV